MPPPASRTTSVGPADPPHPSLPTAGAGGAPGPALGSRHALAAALCLPVPARRSLRPRKRSRQPHSLAARVQLRQCEFGTMGRRRSTAQPVGAQQCSWNTACSWQGGAGAAAGRLAGSARGAGSLPPVLGTRRCTGVPADSHAALLCGPHGRPPLCAVPRECPAHARALKCCASWLSGILLPALGSLQRPMHGSPVTPI